MKKIGGLPVWYYGVGLAALVGGVYFVKKYQKGSASSAGTVAQPAFSQQQEVQDFQIFSQLSSQQQASDLSFVGQMLSLFGGGGSGSSSQPPGGGGGSGSSSQPPGGGGGGSGRLPVPPTGGGTNPTPNPPSPTPSTTGSGSTPHPGTAVINGHEYYVLGHPGSKGYNVSNGAPVYATWTGQGNPEQGFSTSTRYPGEVLYTPTSTPIDQIHSGVLPGF